MKIKEIEKKDIENGTPNIENELNPHSKGDPLSKKE